VTVGLESQPPQLPLRDRPRLRRHQVTQAVRASIAADSFLVGINLQHVRRPVRIVLQRRQRLNQPPAALVDEKRRTYASLNIT